ncbi:hypothetical protein FQN60_018605 [Etheostoma spectabile]|uniref:Uncharacterized protein n=1 Tax=Etheostoma spectabile TaxID=54343 RepID=A0A5J5CAD8_9PERO|nr:hypothetical protein FQN60_018605 [Etheostoma spectabile]
MQKPLKMPPLL